MKRLLATVLAVCMVCTAALAATPAVTDNEDGQNYSWNWASPVKSYLYVRADGGLSRVEWTGEELVVEDYDQDFVLQGSRAIQPELPIFGGFFAGEDYNFLFFGQNNEEEDDSKEVVRVVRYDKGWNRLGSDGLFGANTIHPFEAGSLRCAEGNGYLYVRTCHEMYTSSDGLNHQANMTLYVREADGVITNAFYEVATTTVGYVSHSFNQFVVYNEDGRLVALDHGDAYPRSLVLHRWTPYPADGRYTPQITEYGDMDIEWDYNTGGALFYRDKAGKVIAGPVEELELLHLPGQIGHNYTGCAVGGFAETSQGYLAVYQWNSGVDEGKDSVYLSFLDKELDWGTVEKDVYTPLDQGEGCSVPQLAAVGPEGGYILWNGMEEGEYYNDMITDELRYVTYDASGNVSQVKTAVGRLSDCQPIPYGDGIVWYVTENSVPTFYTLDDTGVTAHYARTYPAGKPGSVTVEEMPMTGTAYFSEMDMTLDGGDRELSTYALKDAAGNLTNYVELRRAAQWLENTAARMDVEWDGRQILISSQHPYAHKTEGPYGGWMGDYEEPYTVVTAPILVDGVMVWVNAFCLTDENGGGHTYYKLRDLGALLNFYVGWDGSQVVIDTTRDHE